MDGPINMSADVKGKVVCGKLTICEVHRQLYDLIVIHMDDSCEQKTEMLHLLDKAFNMGVRLVKKLVDRKIELLEWEKNENVEEVQRLRDLRIYLQDKKEV